MCFGLTFMNCETSSIVAQSGVCTFSSSPVGSSASAKPGVHRPRASSSITAANASDTARPPISAFSTLAA